ncbi:putative Sulfotransferase domain protein [uncultured Desulfobacterium sp.]|uniref:Putative Sulfotransferase domain protein n=1 Tax=uncultured Desulfobacterium sp. TaxID=201089 RepID=A0A445MS54_9BACT|nr:putative Sulfotransferase domain protein [uncultured Desulfobacterium sp.]
MPTLETVARREKRYRIWRHLSILKYPVLSIFQRRRFHAFCIDTPKSGTHSIAGLFEQNFRAAHEPQAYFLIKLIHDLKNGNIDERAIARFFRTRDKDLWLDLESSHFNSYFVHILVREFPKARFILTIRDCYSWLDSWFNHQLSRSALKGSSIWKLGRDIYYRPKKVIYTAEEKVLKENGLYPLDGYLSFWREHNARVLHYVPPQRLLVVRTKEIRQSVKKLSNFLNVSAVSLQSKNAHLYKARQKFGLLKLIDRNFLEHKVHLHCRDLMKRFFPEIRSLDDTVEGIVKTLVLVAYLCVLGT